MTDEDALRNPEFIKGVVAWWRKKRMLDEQALRRPEFAEGIPIRLTDGQEWHFPEPVLTFLPEFDAAGEVTGFGAARRSFGPDWDRKLDAFVEADPGSLDEVNHLLILAVDLLRRNYTLGPADLRTLLPLSADGTDRAMWEEIATVILGTHAPKPSADGSARPA